MENEQTYFLTTKIDNQTVVYCSSKYSISELEMIQLIRLLYIQKRNKSLGEKILEVYRDSTKHKKDSVKENLKRIGIEDEEPTEKLKKRSFEER